MHTNTATPSNLLTKIIDNLDLDCFENVTSGVVTLKNPKTGEPTASTITLASPEHPARKKIDLDRTRRLRGDFAANGKLTQTDPLEDHDEETDYLVAATLDWNLIQGGQPIPCTAENARRIYTDPKRVWVRDQALAGVRKSELFIAASAKA